MPTQRPSKGGPVPKGSRTGGLITMSGRRTEVNKHQIRWSLTKTHKDLSTRYWLLERACEPDQVPAHPGPGLIPRPEHQAPKPQSNRCCSPPPVLRTRTSHQPPRARHQAPRPDQATEGPGARHPRAGERRTPESEPSSRISAGTQHPKHPQRTRRQDTPHQPGPIPQETGSTRPPRSLFTPEPHVRIQGHTVV